MKSQRSLIVLALALLFVSTPVWATGDDQPTELETFCVVATKKAVLGKNSTVIGNVAVNESAVFPKYSLVMQGSSTIEGSAAGASGAGALSLNNSMNARRIRNTARSQTVGLRTTSAR